jgi:hypothetical protein
MTNRRSTARRRKTAGPGILLRYRDSDSAYGVSRGTAIKLAETLGLSETQVIHVALAQFARQNLPQYEPDDGPLTPGQMEEIRRLQPPGRMKTRESLF